MRFLHAADIHLGRAYKRLPPEAAEVCRSDLREAFRHLVALALARDVDAILLAGDLFDEPLPGQDLVRFVRYQLEMSVAGRAEIYSVTGNHDPGVPGSPYGSGGLGPVTTLATPSWERREILGGRCVLWSIGYDWGNESRRVLQELSHRIGPADVPQVVLVHADYDGGGGAQHYMPFSREEAESLPVSYIATGHVHARETPVSRPPTCYPGPIEFISFKSQAEQYGCLMVEIASDGRTEVEFAPLSTTRVCRIEVDLTGMYTPEAVREALAQRVRPDQIAHVRLVGLRELSPSMDAGRLAAELSDVCLATVVDDRTRGDLDLEATPGTVKDEFIRRVRQRLAELPEGADEDAARELQLVMAYGVAALDGVRL